MDDEDVPTVERLALPPPSDSSSNLHKKAQQILATYQAEPSMLALPETLRELLIQIIKPLFSANQHPSLAPSGRKAHFAPAPTIPYASPIVLDDSDKLWKLAFQTLTYPLLSSILATYPTLPPESLKPAIEQQIFFLTPALLNLIDDVSPTSKAAGFRLLSRLSAAVSAAGSNILEPSGLTDVFIDAIKPNFMLLPSLTPEDDSLLIMRELYPVYLALIDARYQQPPNSPTQATPSTPDTKRYDHLLLALRHGLLASLHHLDAGRNTRQLPLTTFLVTQLIPFITKLGICITAHLNELLPLLRKLLCDPFATAAPPLVLATLDAVQAVCRVAAAPRIRDRWWAELLRGCVGIWTSVVDDEAAGVSDGAKKAELREVKERCRETMGVLERVAEPEVWREAKGTLVEAEPELEGLYA